MAQTKLSKAAIVKCWQQIGNKYGEANRHYHNLDHLSALFASFDQYKTELAEPLVVACAIWYHDIVYNAKRNDNEAQSALVAAQNIAHFGLSEEQQQRCLHYICATAQHLEVKVGAQADLAYFLDFDLAVLAWPRAQYKAYAEAIRKEYRHVPSFFYRRGRRKVLKYFLEVPRLFRTAEFQEKFEAAAKLNLHWELETL
ncbi:MAG: hypothetical protein AAGJ93_06395 [Bacteroidota bacterium]